MTKSRVTHLKAAYGLTVQQWDATFERQRGICPLCLKVLHRPGNAEGKRAAAVDHDHRTKRVRGLVHWRCNRFLIGPHTLVTAERLVRYLASPFDGRML